MKIHKKNGFGEKKPKKPTKKKKKGFFEKNYLKNKNKKNKI